MQFSQVRPIRISIDKPSRRFRWKSDVKQQQENGNRRCNISHGNYLDGKIELPTLNGGGKYRLELALVPSQQSLFKAHPCLLHLTHPKTFQSLIEVCKENWKIAFELDMEKFELEKKHTQQLRIPLEMDQHGRVFISLGPGKVMLTVIKPKQTTASSNEDVTVHDVLQERLIHELHEPNGQQLAIALADAYKRSETELPRCRLKATLFNQFGVKEAEGISELDIIDSGNKNVGDFGVDMLSFPNFCCTEGGFNFQTILTSSVNIACKKKQLTIFPVFVLETEDDHFEPASQYLQQEHGAKFQPITDVDCLGKRLAFRIPKQDDPIFQGLIQAQKLSLFITLQRSTDGAFAKEKLEFTYLPHRETDCICHYFNLDYVRQRLLVKSASELLLQPSPRPSTRYSTDSGAVMDDTSIDEIAIIEDLEFEDDNETKWADAFDVMHARCSPHPIQRKRRKTETCIELGFQNIQLAEQAEKPSKAVQTPKTLTQWYCHLK